MRDVHTVNERQFRDTYKNQIATALDVYKWNKLDPRKAWQPFKQLLIHLTQRCNKRSLQTLQTAEVSPRLLAFCHSHVSVAEIIRHLCRLLNSDISLGYHSHIFVLESNIHSYFLVLSNANKGKSGTL
uniref:FAT domain-containing protein n=1 Tax=Ascaris lumbricoides TaxID=6252 RepID=A0A0M3HHY8_ASCLU